MTINACGMNIPSELISKITDEMDLDDFFTFMQVTSVLYEKKQDFFKTLIKKIGLPEDLPFIKAREFVKKNCVRTSHSIDRVQAFFDKIELGQNARLRIDDVSNIATIMIDVKTSDDIQENSEYLGKKDIFHFTETFSTKVNSDGLVVFPKSKFPLLYRQDAKQRVIGYKNNDLGILFLTLTFSNLTNGEGRLLKNDSEEYLTNFEKQINDMALKKFDEITSQYNHSSGWCTIV